jgi:hypothetical protein
MMQVFQIAPAGARALWMIADFPNPEVVPILRTKKRRA